MPGSTKSETKLENGIRISYKSDALDYVYKAIVLFETHDEVILSGVGKAISSVVNVAEMIKRRAKGLHQFTQLYEKEHIIKREDTSGLKKNDKGDDKKSGDEEEGGEGEGEEEENDKNKESANRVIEFSTTVPCMKITLSKSDANIDKDQVGYQKPLDDKDVKVMTPEEILKEKAYRRRYRRGRGGDRYRGSYRRQYYDNSMWNNRRYEKRNN